MDLIGIRRALLSVTDKTGIVDLARGLARHDVVILSTGGTAAALREAGIRVTDVAAVTGTPEMLGGRVKTLHPKIHGGILADRDAPRHREDMAAHGIDGIDLVVVNLYAFEKTVARPDVTFAEAVENIDIGGPGMIRAAAKNHRHVAVVTDPSRYSAILAALDDKGGVPRSLARELAAEAFRRTADYDAAIAEWFRSALDSGDSRVDGGGAGPASAFPEALHLRLAKDRDLRYGENPHQGGAVYLDPGERWGVGAVRQLGGKEMSYTNYLDLDAAIGLLAEFPDPAAIVLKHLNPCGVGFADTIEGAWRHALASDPLSAFGGIVGLNRPCDPSTAAALVETFLEIVIAPEFPAESVAILSRKKNLRILELPAAALRPPGPERQLRRISGGYLYQDENPPGAPPEFRTVTKRPPDDAERRAMDAAWRIVKHVKSNAIVLADRDGLLGMGSGRTSRVDAVEDAIRKAEKGRGIGDSAALASDAFFPFPDSVERAHAAGIRALIQPGGSIKDSEVIAAADAHDMAMVFTGRRVFLH